MSADPYTLVRAVARNRFVTDYPAIRPSDKYGFDSEPLDPKPAPNEAWLRFRVRESGNPLQSMGGTQKTFFATGNVVIDIFTPTNSEADEILARTMANAVRQVFRPRNDPDDFNMLYVDTSFYPNVGFDQSVLPGVYNRGTSYTRYEYQFVE